MRQSLSQEKECRKTGKKYSVISTPEFIPPIPNICSRLVITKCKSRPRRHTLATTAHTTQNVSITSAKKATDKGTYVCLLDVMSHVMNIKVVSTKI